MKKTSLLLILMFAGAVAGWAADKKSDGRLLAYWNFDEGSGAVCKDLSGNGHDLKIMHDMRGVKWVDGRKGKALHFIAEPNKEKNKAGAAMCALNPVWDFTRGFSLECWLKMDAQADWQRSVFYIFCNSPGNYGPGFNLFYNWRNYMLSCGDGYKRKKETYWTSAASVPDLRGQWVHLAATYDGSTAKIYVNGECKGVKDNAVYYKHKARSSSFTIGSGWQGLQRGFPGIIDEMKIFDYALPASEIIRHAKLDI